MIRAMLAATVVAIAVNPLISYARAGSITVKQRGLGPHHRRRFGNGAEWLRGCRRGFSFVWLGYRLDPVSDYLERRMRFARVGVAERSGREKQHCDRPDVIFRRGQHIGHHRTGCRVPGGCFSCFGWPVRFDPNGARFYQRGQPWHDGVLVSLASVGSGLFHRRRPDRRRHRFAAIVCRSGRRGHAVSGRCRFSGLHIPRLLRRQFRNVRGHL